MKADQEWKKTKCVPDTFQQIQSVDLKSDQQFVLLPPLYYTFFFYWVTRSLVTMSMALYTYPLMLTSAQKNTLLFD